ncbi:hypothetical protein [Taibaiella chishuiensis]|uniref:DUF2116 family Zn-ribbon domain-containing protein n=1 Tax=Taibaiella chishuiensis TaxID=1434707 RepID=A0A2P8CT58_9BACT|nr:hypothetical protein [Taibaiella chishuiensis]PSK88155.1 hypothetical protein B0I18_11549 [Taibaiella chishuiensis]
METTTHRLCQACQKLLRGRLDKKFCDDYCRNTFNNHRNSDQNNLVRNINNALRKNRRLLEMLIPEGEDLKKIRKEHLVMLGFNFKYHTQHVRNQKGQVYYFSYEYGFLELEEEWLLVVRRKLDG